MPVQEVRQQVIVFMAFALIRLQKVIPAGDNLRQARLCAGQQRAPVVLVDLKAEQQLKQTRERALPPERLRPRSRVLVRLVCSLVLPLGEREQQVVVLLLLRLCRAVEPVGLVIERRVLARQPEQRIAHGKQHVLQFGFGLRAGFGYAVRLGHVKRRCAGLREYQLSGSLTAQAETVLAAVRKPLVIPRVVGADLRHFVLA